MESGYTQRNSDPEQTACRAAWEPFGQLVRALMGGLAQPMSSSSDPLSIVRAFAVEAEQWLKSPASMPPSWQPLHALSALGVAGMGDLVRTSQRMVGLLAQWSQLQTQLAGRWSGVARLAGEKFTARMTSPPPVADLKAVRRLYDCWIECAEQAYAETVHSDEFCRLQAELVNVSCALLLEHRRQIESVGTAFGLASRSEVEALRDEIRQVRNAGRTGARGRAGRQRVRKEKPG